MYGLSTIRRRQQILIQAAINRIASLATRADFGRVGCGQAQRQAEEARYRQSKNPTASAARPTAQPIHFCFQPYLGDESASLRLMSRFSAIRLCRCLFCALPRVSQGLTIAIGEPAPGNTERLERLFQRKSPRAVCFPFQSHVHRRCSNASRSPSSAIRASLSLASLAVPDAQRDPSGSDSPMQNHLTHHLFRKHLLICTLYCVLFMVFAGWWEPARFIDGDEVGDWLTAADESEDCLTLCTPGTPVCKPRGPNGRDENSQPNPPKPTTCGDRRRL